MNEQFDPRTRSRVNALYAYTRALEEGNPEIVAHVLQEAEQDSALERMILELHEASLDATQLGQLADLSSFYTFLRSYTPLEEEGQLSSLNGRSSSRDQTAVSVPEKETVNERIPPHMPTTDILFSEKPPLSPEKKPGRRRSRLVRAFQSLAAILVISTLIAGFAFLAHSHQSSQEGGSTLDDILTAASQSGTIYGLSKSGQVLWSYGIQHQVDNMVQQGEAVYIATHESSLAGSSVLYKFDVRNGHVLWEKAVPRTAGIEIDSVSKLLVDSNAIVIGGTDAFEVLSASNGSFLWGSGNAAGLQILAEYNHVLYTYGPQAFQLTTGKHLWSASPPVSTEHMVFTDQAIYVLGVEGGSNAGTITVLNITNGQKLKTVQIKNGSNPTGNANNANSTNLLYVTSPTLQDCAIRLVDGTTAWCSQAQSPSSFPSPGVGLPATLQIDGGVMMNGTLYLMQHVPQLGGGAQYRQIIALNNSSGKQIWQMTIKPAGLGTGILGVNDQLSVFTDHGLFTFSGKDGHLLWSSLTGVSLSHLSGPDQGQITALVSTS